MTAKEEFEWLKADMVVNYKKYIAAMESLSFNDMGNMAMRLHHNECFYKSAISNDALRAFIQKHK